MLKKDRVINQFTRDPVDYLPSQITFSDRTRYKEISEALELDDVSQLDDYLENHIEFTFVLDDVPLFFRSNASVMAELEKKGYVRVNKEENTVYDRWGMGILTSGEGYFTNYGCLAGIEAKNNIARPFLPESITRLWDMSFEQAVEAYEAPDPMSEDNLEWLERDKNGVKGDLCAIPSGYVGVFERAYSLLGFQTFMTEIAANPKMIYGLLEKITDYRMKLVKPKADMGYKIIHQGDDLATQCGGFFSDKMFKEILFPHYKRLFEECKKYDLYIMMHSCGHMVHYLPDLISIGLDAWEPVQPCNDLKFVKREYGKDLVFMGGIDTQTLPFKTPEQVTEMTREAIEVLGKGGGYIIAPSQELMNDVPLENVVAMLKTAVYLRDKVI